jgi:hypothetical protein
VIFIVEKEHDLPSVVLALQASGHAMIVSDGPLGEDSATSTTDVELPDSGTVHIRLGEPSWGRPIADVTVAKGDNLEARAIGLAKATTTMTTKRKPSATLPPMRALDDSYYADTPYPSRELRLLAAMRVWAVLKYFNPYKRLVPDWDGALREALPRVEAAQDRTAYLHALREMAVRARDGHIYVWSKDAKPRSVPAVELRLVEGRVLVTRLLDAQDASKQGVSVGDIVEAIDGTPIAKQLADTRAITSGATVEARDQSAAAAMVIGDDGTAIKLSLLHADGKRHEATLVRRAAYFRKPPDGPHWRKLATGVGYVDLRLLEVPEVDTMLRDLASARAIVFDMRGYPNGTAWALAPRMHTKHATYSAEVFRPLVQGKYPVDMSVHFLLPLPHELPKDAAVYTGKVVMLIDDRAVSQAEATCLMLREAADATFVGSPSAGTDGDVTIMRLPGGLEMSFTGQEIRFADGSQLQQVGVQPTILIRPTIAGIRTGKDEVLDRALSYISTGK